MLIVFLTALSGHGAGFKQKGKVQARQELKSSYVFYMMC